MPVKGGGTSRSKPRSRRGTASRGQTRSSSPKKSKPSGTKKSSKKRKSRSVGASDKAEKRPPVDMLDPEVMRNLYCIAHDAPDALSMRGFGWPDAPKGKKKRGGGKGKKKKKKK